MSKQPQKPATRAEVRQLLRHRDCGRKCLVAVAGTLREARTQFECIGARAAMPLLLLIDELLSHEEE